MALNVASVLTPPKTHAILRVVLAATCLDLTAPIKVENAVLVKNILIALHTELVRLLGLVHTPAALAQTPALALLLHRPVMVGFLAELVAERVRPVLIQRIPGVVPAFNLLIRNLVVQQVLVALEQAVEQLAAEDMLHMLAMALHAVILPIDALVLHAQPAATQALRTVTAAPEHKSADLRDLASQSLPHVLLELVLIIQAAVILKQHARAMEIPVKLRGMDAQPDNA